MKHDDDYLEFIRSQGGRRSRLSEDVEIARRKQPHLSHRQIEGECIAEILDDIFPEGEVEPDD